jgi:hypothetical protein
MKRKILTLSPSPADCKKLSINSQHPSPQGEGNSGNPTASGWGIKKIKNPHQKDVAFIRPPKRELPIGNIGFLISNAKAQMPNECQMTNAKTRNK